MAGNRSTAWVFPVVILAVPGVMFYVWWSQLNAEQRKQMTQKIRRRTPEVFTASPAGSPLVNPIAQQAAAAPAEAAPQPAPGAQVAPGAVPVSAPAAAMPGGAQPAALAQGMQPGAPDAGQAPAAPPSQPGQPEQPQPGAAPAVPPALPIAEIPPALLARDPTLSPFDVMRMEQLRLEQELEARRLEEERNRIRVKRDPPVDSLIDLQGVISTPDSGNKAIINGEIVGEGEIVSGAKVVRITTQGVVFLHKGRKFTKTISR